jgi:hypothetical protein
MDHWMIETDGFKLPRYAQLILGDLLTRLDEFYEFENGPESVYLDLLYILELHFRNEKK